MTQTDLSQYDNAWYQPGGFPKRLLWHFVNALVFRSPLFPFSGPKVSLLRAFGARVGKGVVVKPSVNIKYPWFLSVGPHSWIGEGAWIDNLGRVSIGSNVCISQGALLLCGNHDHRKVTFDLIVRDITLEDGVWIGAQSVVGPGVTCGSHAVLMLGSVAIDNLAPYTFYQGNPAQKVRERTIKEA